MRMQGLSPAVTPSAMQKLQTVQKDTDHSFAKVLMDSLKEVNRLQNESVTMDKLFAAGVIDNIADVTIAAAKADISLNYAVEIINKMFSAYNELMRLQL